MKRNPNELISTTEAAKILKVSESRVRQFCQAGRLGIKVGRNYVIPREQLRDFAKTERPVGKHINQ